MSFSYLTFMFWLIALSAPSPKAEKGVYYCGEYHPLDTTRVSCHVGKNRTLAREAADLSPLIPLKDLRVLSLADVPVTSLEPLTKLESLFSLILMAIPTQLDFKPLTHVTTLERLSISGATFSDLSVISEIKSLKGLDVSLKDRHQVLELSHLAGHSQLESLILSYMGASGLSALGSLENLKSLSFYSVSTSETDFSFVANLKQLESFVAQGVPISDLSFLNSLHKLRHASFRSFPTIDLSVLRASKDVLEELYVVDTPLHDIQVLSEFAKLKELYLLDTKVTDPTPLYSVKSLRYVDFRGSVPLNALRKLKRALPRAKIEGLYGGGPK